MQTEGEPSEAIEGAEEGETSGRTRENKLGELEEEEEKLREREERKKERNIERREMEENEEEMKIIERKKIMKEELNEELNAERGNVSFYLLNSVNNLINNNIIKLNYSMWTWLIIYLINY